MREEQHQVNHWGEARVWSCLRVELPASPRLPTHSAHGACEQLAKELGDGEFGTGELSFHPGRPLEFDNGLIVVQSNNFQSCISFVAFQNTGWKVM